MKTMAELQEIRERVGKLISLREENSEPVEITKGMYRSQVLVCGGTGCTSSNAEKIISTLKEELEKALAHYT